MAGFVTNPPFGVQDPSGARAVSAISINTRARGSKGLIATQADALVFPGPFVSGMWTIPNTRVAIAGVRVIDATSTGLAFSPPGPQFVSGPITVVTSDPRVTRP